MPIERVRRAFLARLPLAERTEILSVLRDETTGGFVLLVATAAALLWANLGTESYLTVSETVIGPASLHLDLSVAAWSADALLAVFLHDGHGEPIAPSQPRHTCHVRPQSLQIATRGAFTSSSRKATAKAPATPPTSSSFGRVTAGNT